MPSRGTELADQLITYAINQKDYKLLGYIQERISTILNDTTATVKTAVLLSNSDQQELTTSIKNRFPEASGVRFEMDAGLIGGIEVMYKDYRYDGSVKGTLSQLKGSIL